MKSKLAKFFGWLGALISAASASGVLGKYSGIAQIVGSGLLGLGVHQAAVTDGSK